MKYFPVLLFLIISVGCTTKKESSKLTDSLPIDSLTIENRTVYLDSINLSEFETTHYDGIKEIDSLSVDTTKIIVKHDTILIFPKTGKKVVFANDTIEGENMVTYKYLKTMKLCDVVEIEVTYWEWSRIFLVSLNTGKQSELWDFPNFSPNKKYIISSSGGLESGEMPNGIQLYKIENNDIKLVFEKEIDKWIPTEIKWKSDSTILIKRAKLDKNDNRIYDYLKMKIIQ
ncbi:MAG: hypothetical protein JZU53_06550 [Paludibacter sp.]|nr:hypothetical protein [Paludibacter sp.]